MMDTCKRTFRLLYICTHFTCQQGNVQNPTSQASTVCEPKTSRCSSWIQKQQRNQRSNCQHPLDHRKIKGIPKNICFIDYTKAFDCVDHNQLWKILKEMGIPDHLTCLLRNLYASQEATVRTRHGTQTGSKSEKEHVKVVYCYPAYLTYMQSTSREMLGWMKHKLQFRLSGEIQITSDMQITPPYGRK